MAKTGWHAPIQTYVKPRIARWKQERVAKRISAAKQLVRQARREGVPSAQPRVLQRLNQPQQTQTRQAPVKVDKTGGFETYGGIISRWKERRAEKARLAAVSTGDVKPYFSPNDVKDLRQRGYSELQIYQLAEADKKRSRNLPKRIKIIEPSGHYRYADRADFDRAMAARVAEKEMLSKEAKRIRYQNNPVVRAAKFLYKAVPGLSETVRPMKFVRTKSGGHWVPTTYGAKIEAARRRVQEDRLTHVEKKQIMFKKKLTKFMYPGIPAIATQSTYGVQSKAGQMGKTRGRPKGSYDPRYAAYQGVLNYRKALSMQRRSIRERFRQQQELLKYQRQQQRLAEMQMPQDQRELQQATPEYSQFPTQGVEEYPTQQVQVQQVQQVQQAMPEEEMALASQPVMQEYPAQEMPRVYPQPPQQAPQRPVATVFKGSGGSPYPPVDRRPLAPPRQTIPSGYVEVADAFTSKRYLKKLPQAERWSK